MECLEKYLWNAFATKVHLKASASAIVQAVEEGFKERSVIRVLMVGDRYSVLSRYILPRIEEKGMKQQLEYTFAASTGSILQNHNKSCKILLSSSTSTWTLKET